MVSIISSSHRSLLAGAILALMALRFSPPGLEGRWVLVEQTYGKGGKNLADGEKPLRLELYRETSGLNGRVWRGEQRGATRNWPVWMAEGRMLPVEVSRKEETPPGKGLRVEYRVRPSLKDPVVLEVVEAYRLEEEGTVLLGTVHVTFRLGEEERGSFTLHRRFERMP